MNPRNPNYGSTPLVGMLLLLSIGIAPSITADPISDMQPLVPDMTPLETTESHDTTPPVITGISSSSHPSENLWYYSNVFYGSISATDVGTGVRGYSYKVVASESTDVPACYYQSYSNNVVWSNINYGVNEIRAMARDGGYNCSDIFTRTINVDNIDPVITRTIPGEGAVISGSDRQITVEYNDRDLNQDREEENTQVNRAKVFLTIDGVDRTTQSIITKNQLIYTSPLGFTVGDHTIKIQIQDTAVGSNIVTKTWTFRVSPGAAIDGDGDAIPDALEEEICRRESKGTPRDGTCSESEDGSNYHPPADPIEIVGEGLSEIVNPFRNGLGVTGRIQIGPHFN